MVENIGYEICGHSNPEVIETHHLVPRRLGGTDATENLVDLCGPCHNAIESIFDDEYFNMLFDKVGYELKTNRREYEGRKANPIHSWDREFPPQPVHVKVESVDWQFVVEDLGVVTYDELDEMGVIDIMSDVEYIHWKTRMA